MRFCISLFLLAVPLIAADAPNPAEARLREALRQLTARVQTAEAEAVSAKAVQAELEAKNKTLSAQVEKLVRQADTDKAAAEKAAEAGEAKLKEQEAELTQTKEALEKWKFGHGQVTELVRKTEAARATLAAKSSGLELRVADLTRKNLALFKLGEEVLTRLEKFSYGGALAAREPFVGTMRVKLENQVQGYRDRLLDPKLTP